MGSNTPGNDVLQAQNPTSNREYPFGARPFSPGAAGVKDNSNAIKLRPNLFISYASHHQGRFTETGADLLNLELHSHTADSLLAGLGMELELPFVLNASNRHIPRFFVGYEHDFMGDTNQEHELKTEFAMVPALGSSSSRSKPRQR